MAINDEIVANVPIDGDYYYLTLTTDGEHLTVGLITNDDIFSTENDDRKIIDGGDYEPFETYLRRKINQYREELRQIPEL